MTAQNVKGCFAFSCDGCPETIEPDAQDSFPAAWTEAAEKGWKSYRVKNVWQHRCPACAEEI